MKPTVIPFLILIEFIAIWYAARRAQRLGHITSSGVRLINILLVMLGGWAAVSTYLSVNLIYQNKWFLASWPAFWLAFIPVTFVIIPLLISRANRDSFRGLIDATPLHWLVGFQALRILAIGGILKALNGEFSLYFGLFIGIPDLIFGLSALVVGRLVLAQRISNKSVAVWNMLGATIIVPVSVVLMQLGLPGPWQVFAETPTIATIFAFPMALAPTLVVPIFVMMNLLVAFRLIERAAGFGESIGLPNT